MNVAARISRRHWAASAFDAPLPGNGSRAAPRRSPFAVSLDGASVETVFVSATLNLTFMHAQPGHAHGLRAASAETGAPSARPSC